jgi:hypothetical protein
MIRTCPVDSVGLYSEEVEVAPRRRSLAVVALIMFLGIVVGSVIGQAIGLLLPEGKVIRDVFVNSTDFHVGPLHIDLVVFSFTFGFSLRVNLMSAVGVFLVALILRWYW